MAFTGGGDARSMAGGVSKATLPTMAGMVSSLSGVLVMIWIKNKVEENELLMGEYVTHSYTKEINNEKNCNISSIQRRRKRN